MSAEQNPVVPVTLAFTESGYREALQVANALGHPTVHSLLFDVIHTAKQVRRNPAYTRVAELHAVGMSDKQIADATGQTRANIARIRRDVLGLPVRKQYQGKGPRAKKQGQDA